jgi:NAD(P)-dependent dehydrogenase (short-subunit alcohol dehydrogenase family)
MVPTPDRPLAGKIAIVTGAGSTIGIGHAITLALVKAGARVAMLDVDSGSLEQSAAEARAAGGPECASTVVADVTDPADCERAVQRTISDLGGLHILVNNAGINPRSDAFWETRVEDWTRTMAVNLNGPFFMARAAAPHLRAQGWGRLISVTTSLDTMLRSLPYGPSKAGHEALLTVMARHLEGSGVTANVLVPGGAANTNMVPRERHGPQLLNPEVMQVPVVWLASEASNGVSGRRITAQLWDESLPIEQRLETASAPAGWFQLGRQVRG